MSDKTPKTLYHYTNAQGLLGILQNRILRATDIRHLNDTQELRHGIETMVAALRHAATKLKPEGAKDITTQESAAVQATALRLTATRLARGGLFDRNPAGDVYVACFCDDWDQLGQWRRYRADGGGFAVGFRTEALTGLAHWLKSRGGVKVPAPVEAPQRVLYNSEEQEQRCEEVVAHILALSANAGPFSAGGLDAVHICLPALVFMKHHDFEHENEWRVLLINSADRTLPFRPGASGVIPYIEIRFPADAVAEVVVGPGPHPDLRTQEVEQLLRSQGFNDVDVRLSKMPYRP